MFGTLLFQNPSTLFFSLFVYSAIPDPENHCFETSPFPGCLNQTCLEAVCQSNPFSNCCDSAYSIGCVEMARQFPQYCQPPQFDNRCDESYPFGGCNDPECQEQVCNIRQECCNTNERIGEWSSACVQIAADTCGGRSCFLRWYEQGCGDPVCEEFICQLDDFCCKRSWDSTCVQLATEHSNICRLRLAETIQTVVFQAEPFGRPGCINDPVCQKHRFAINNRNAARNHIPKDCRKNCLDRM